MEDLGGEALATRHFVLCCARLFIARRLVQSPCVSFAEVLFMLSCGGGRKQCKRRKKDVGLMRVLLPMLHFIVASALPFIIAPAILSRSSA